MCQGPDFAENPPWNAQKWRSSENPLTGFKKRPKTVDLTHPLT